MAETRLLTVAQVAELAGVSPDTIRRAINAGELAETRLGKTLRISEKSYDDWVRRNTRKARL